MKPNEKKPRPVSDEARNIANTIKGILFDYYGFELPNQGKYEIAALIDRALGRT